MVKINGQAQHTKGKELDSFKGGGNFLSAGEYTVVVKEIETDNIDKYNYITLVFGNSEGKEYRHNMFLPPFNQEWQEQRYIELLARLGIELDTENGNLSFDTDQLINKACNIVLKRKWNEDQEKLFTEFSFNKVWNKGDEVVNQPQPMTDEEKALLNGGGNSADSYTQAYGQEPNPYAPQGNNFNAADFNDDDLPF